MRCDTNGDWRLTRTEAVKCIPDERWYKLTNNDGFCGNNCPKDKVDPVVDLLEFADRNADDQLSLEEYVWVRKAASAWRQCVMGNGMNYKELECALRLTSDNSAFNAGDARKSLE